MTLGERPRSRVAPADFELTTDPVL